MHLEHRCVEHESELQTRAHRCLLQETPSRDEAFLVWSRLSLGILCIPGPHGLSPLLPDLWISQSWPAERFRAICILVRSLMDVEALLI